MWDLRIIRLTFAVAILSASIQSITSCPLKCDCQPIDGKDGYMYAKCDNFEMFDDTKLMETIKYLNVSNANLKELPKTLEHYDFEGIDLSNNELSKLVKFSTNMRNINLSHNHFSSDSLLDLPHNVEELDLSYNRITFLPIDLTKFVKLRSLELSGNEIDCTCETLEVRNWLEQHNVQMNHPIKCRHPQKFKDVSWSSVKDDLCNILTNDFDEDGNPFDDNRMLNDDPNVIDNLSTENDDDDEIEKDFILADHSKGSESPLIDNHEGSGHDNSKIDRVKLDVVEGSGDNILELDENDEEVHDHSGSGGGALPVQDVILRKYNVPVQSELFNKLSNTTEEDSGHDVQSTTESIHHFGNEELFKHQLGIMKPYDEDSTKMASTSSPDILDKPEGGASVTSDKTENEKKADIQAANDSDHSHTSQASAGGSMASDDRNTYILLGVIMVIVLAIIIFVAIKRRRPSRAGVRPKDTENYKGTELVYMKGNNDPEKPIDKYKAPEKAPLIEEVQKVNETKNTYGDTKKDADNMLKEPLLNGNESRDVLPSEKRNGVNESKNTAEIPNIQQDSKQPTENVSVEKSKRDHSPATKGIETYPPPKTKTESPYPSPRPSRYSPVYSPETGRVKIKLTETPAPKTPQLITKGSANGGASLNDNTIVP